jgi:CubicO group peptidase (beta-lactamase class C family)
MTFTPPASPRHRHVAALVLLITATLCASADEAPAIITAVDAPALTAAFSPVASRIQGWIDRGYYTGASLVVVRDGATLCERRFGDHDASTVEFIASAGKWLAAATIMAAVDAGRLSLDDTAHRWLPGIDGVLGRATLRQMLAHTAGFQTYQPAGNPADRYQTLSEAVEHIVPLPPAAEPGQRWVYGGLAMQVAGRMAEVASGEPWPALFQRTIATPLGMTATTFTPVDAGVGHSPMLGGGARSTLADYARFLAMLSHDGMHQGRRVLSTAAIAAMQADQVGAAAIPPDNFVTSVRGASHHGIYGLGEWRELEDPAGRVLLVSSPSWAGTYPWIDHRHRLFGVFLAHVRGPAASRDHFNPMFASAELPLLVEQAVRQLPGP